MSGSSRDNEPDRRLYNSGNRATSTFQTGAYAGPISIDLDSPVLVFWDVGKMARLELFLLGDFQVTLDGQPIHDLGTDKARALLAYLALGANRAHRRDTLASLLWGESPQRRARQSLRQALFHLRRALRDQDRDIPFLLVDYDVVRFNPDSDLWVDATEVTSLAEVNRVHRHRRPAGCLPCIQRMEQMASLYNGPLLADFFLADAVSFEEWASLQREYLHHRVMEALLSLTGYHERRGDLRTAISLARRAVRFEPWREQTHRQLMRLLSLDNQRSAALAQYHSCKQALAEELGVEPSRETTNLYAQIQAQGPDEPGPSTSPTLPVDITPFVGRRSELAELSEWLADPDRRLITMVGPGGIGKTRLALQVAREQQGLFDHGVVLVPLEPLDSADMIAPALAQALHIHLHSGNDPQQQVLDRLRDKDMLLVLDNMEHLTAGTDFITEIIQQAPAISLLVTSRERLRLREEWVYWVNGLSCPPKSSSTDPATFDAVHLFVQTARRLHHTLAPEDMAAIARICRMVEGLPLAIELATAWLSESTCAEISSEIARNLDILTTSLRNVPRRHQSVRAAFEYSWHRLSKIEQAVFCSLAVFAAEFTAEAARQVAGTSAENLNSLVDKSLLRRVRPGWYELHRLLRQFASEKLDATPQQRKALEMRHCEYYTAFLEEQTALLYTGRQTEALSAITARFQDLRAAWRLAVARENGPALHRAMRGMGFFYSIRSWNQEGATAFEQAASMLTRQERTPAHRITLGTALAWQAHFQHQLGNYDKAQEQAEKGLTLLQHHNVPRELGFAYHTLAQIQLYARNNYAEAERLFHKSKSLYEQGGDLHGQAQAVDGLGDVSVRLGNLEQAQQYYAEGLALRRAIGDRWGIAASLGSLGGLAGRRGDYEQARKRFEESLAISRDLKNNRGVAACLHNLSTLAYLREEYAEAQRLRLETLKICREIGYRWGVASALKSLGDVSCRLKEYRQAIRYLKESLAIFQETHDRRSQGYTLNSLGMTAQEMGECSKAEEYFRDAILLAMEIQEPALALDTLAGLAWCMAQRGEEEKALEFLTLVLHHPASEQQTRDRVSPLAAAISSSLTEKAAEQAQRRGRDLDLNQILEMVKGRAT